MAKSAPRTPVLPSRNGKRKSRIDKGSDWHDLVATGPATPMGKLLRHFWQPVALSKDVDAGRAVPLKVMGEEFTLYRGHSGQPYIVAAKCAHRSTLLHIGWVEGECIRCRYHGWKYDGSGQCVEMPAEEASFPPKVKIGHHRAADYAGVIFAFMGEGAPPEMPHFAELERPYGVRWASSGIWPVNWFQRIENSMDAVHVSFVHQESKFGEILSYTIPILAYEETEWGIRQTATRSLNNVRISEFSFPNCNHIVTPTHIPGHDKTGPQPWTDLFNWFVPIDDTHTAFYTIRSSPITGNEAEALTKWLASTGKYDLMAHEAELFKGVLPSDHEGDTGSTFVNAQDYIVQVGQGAIADRASERLGKSDEGVILLRKIFRRELAAAKLPSGPKAWRPRSGFARLPVPSSVPLAPDP
jgi:5,5'-dehydrodivanillate O-demethylase oxygenase subunit